MDLEKLRGKLIVSCQALDDEPLHSSFIMGKMALAAKIGGAVEFVLNLLRILKKFKNKLTYQLLELLKKIILTAKFISLQLKKKLKN